MTRRRIVMFNQVSADGFFSDPEGGLDWVVSDPQIQARALEGMPKTDTMLFGRKTYQQFAAFWPNALRDPAGAGPHGEDKANAAFTAMAHWLNDTKKLVFSKSLARADWNNSEIVRGVDAQQISTLKQEPGKDLLIFGSGTLVSRLSELRLIDEYRFVMCPVLLGAGKTLLRDSSLRSVLELVEAKSFPSGNVMLTYTLGEKP